MSRPILPADVVLIERFKLPMIRFTFRSPVTGVSRPLLLKRLDLPLNEFRRFGCEVPTALDSDAEDKVLTSLLEALPDGGLNALISTICSHFYHVVHDLPIDDFIPDENVLECYEICLAGRQDI